MQQSGLKWLRVLVFAMGITLTVGSIILFTAIYQRHQDYKAMQSGKICDGNMAKLVLPQDIQAIDRDGKWLTVVTREEVLVLDLCEG